MARLHRRTVLRGAVLLGGAAAALATAGQSATASVEQVSIASCGAWGARPPSGALTIVRASGRAA